MNIITAVCHSIGGDYFWSYAVFTNIIASFASPATIAAIVKYAYTEADGRALLHDICRVYEILLWAASQRVKENFNMSEKIKIIKGISKKIKLIESSMQMYSDLCLDFPAV